MLPDGYAVAVCVMCVPWRIYTSDMTRRVRSASDISNERSSVISERSSVGSLKSQVSFAKEPYKRDDIRKILPNGYAVSVCYMCVVNIYTLCRGTRLCIRRDISMCDMTPTSCPTGMPLLCVS